MDIAQIVGGVAVLIFLGFVGYKVYQKSKGGGNSRGGGSLGRDRHK